MCAKLIARGRQCVFRRNRLRCCLSYCKLKLAFGIMTNLRQARLAARSHCRLHKPVAPSEWSGRGVVVFLQSTTNASQASAVLYKVTNLLQARSASAMS